MTIKRLLYTHLAEWAKSSRRKPLLLRGARQVGKTHLVRTLGGTFEQFVEINFELLPDAKIPFQRDLEPNRIIRELSLVVKQKIIPGKTLLFLDEIQEEENVIKALRYFYELLPELHVVAAGSLLDFCIEKIGLPVGRLNILYLYPLTR